MDEVEGQELEVINYGMLLAYIMEILSNKHRKSLKDKEKI